MLGVLVVLFGVLALAAASSVNYCGAKMCGNTNAHTFCQYPKGPSAKCEGYIGSKLGSQEKRRILARFNSLRADAAFGVIMGYPPATNMLKMHWVEELARLAQRWADQCRPPKPIEEHDTCRDLYSVKVGQCVASVVGLRPTRVEQMLDIWYLQNLIYNSSVDNYVPPRNDSGYYGDFAQMFWAKSYMVGCARSRFLVWVEELAREAQRWADQCLPPRPIEEHDTCRDLYSLTVGQCVASVVGDTQVQVEQMVDIWYIQSTLYNNSITSYVPPSNSSKYYGDFAQILWAKSNLVGCGRSRFKLKRLESCKKRYYVMNVFYHERKGSVESVVLVLFGVLSLVATSSVNYCGARMCGNKNTHTYCQYPKGPSPKCVGYENVKLRSREKLRILKRLNSGRNKAAAGGLPGFPPAGNMMKLHWVEELARLAQRWADQCRPPNPIEEHDTCRDLCALERCSPESGSSSLQPSSSWAAATPPNMEPFRTN
ncbi:unnamed protein product [Spodoptera exigua]|nr:unnamed protein product [Spodoptera exigua]